jgi:hypothetical protein
MLGAMLQCGLTDSDNGSDDLLLLTPGSDSSGFRG